MRCILLLASGAGWESTVLDALGDTSGLVVLKRCVDVDDLMASAATQQAELAVVSSEAPGFDGSTVQTLRRHGVSVVAVTPTRLREDAESRLARAGVVASVPESALGTLPAALLALGRAEERTAAVSGVGTTLLPGAPSVASAGSPVPSADVAGASRGRVVAVWGPVGAPGRTTVATAVAGELARRGRATLLVDADPDASVGQHLGVLDEVSGLLAAARGGTTGLSERWPAAARRVDDDLAVLTGLPRPERQVELREGVLAELLGESSLHGDVVVDTGAALESPQGWREPGSGLTLEALTAADEVVVVGSADPVGLARLARGLVLLREEWEETPVRVVVNRMRPTLGWSRSDVSAMVEGFTRISSLHFLPEDRAGVDRALVAGHSVAREPSSALAAGVRELVDALHPETYASGPAPARQGWFSRQRAGTTRPR